MPTTRHNAIAKVKRTTSRGTKRPTAAEVLRMSHADRERILREDAATAAKEFVKHPEWLVGGGEELLRD